ncbi:MAG: inner membrane-spanning protein YciB [Rhodospirillaceae bacterium]
MKAALDFLPLALYLGAYVIADIYVATGVLIAAMAFLVLYSRIVYGKVGKLLWVNLAAAATLGGLTITWSDPRYLVARATAIYWLIGGALLFVYWFGGRNLLRDALQPRFDAPEAVWRRHLYAYVAFFAVLGAGNILLAYTVSEAMWVAFDTVGALVLIGGFMALQLMRIRRHGRVAREDCSPRA